MIELLGVGVRRDKSTWILRNVCARLEAGDLALVASSEPQGRRALIEAVTARRVPDEGRLWVNHVPLLRANARRVRGLCGLVELPGRLVGERSILWNALAPTGAVRALGGLLRLPRRQDRNAVQAALERVGLRGRAQEPAAVLGVADVSGSSWPACWRTGRSTSSSANPTRCSHRRSWRCSWDCSAASLGSSDSA